MRHRGWSRLRHSRASRLYSRAQVKHINSSGSEHQKPQKGEPKLERGIGLGRFLDGWGLMWIFVGPLHDARFSLNSRDKAVNLVRVQELRICLDFSQC